MAFSLRPVDGVFYELFNEMALHLVGGSADLSSSNNTDIEDGGDVQRDDYSGRNLRFGVREHGMGAMVNGLGLE